MTGPLRAGSGPTAALPNASTTLNPSAPGPAASGQAPYPSGLLDAIAAALPTIRRSEQKVAHTVLADPPHVLNSSVADLAKRSGVSEPTVMRFCAALGYTGFQDFKLHLAQSVALGIPATQSVITADDDIDATISKIFAYTVTSLDHARRMLDSSGVSRAVDILHSVDEIIFLGLGASGIVAQDAQQKFPLFGVPCSAPTDTHQQFIAASLATPRTAVVAISNTGRTTSIVEAVTTASAGGAATIGIAGAASPLTRVCDVAIIVETLENTDFYTPAISRLAQLVVIDVLSTAVALRHNPEYVKRLRRMKEQLTAMRTARTLEVVPSAAESDAVTGEPDPGVGHE